MTKQKVPEGLKSSSFQENPANEVSPSQAGDYIMVILGKDEKFRELERRVGGKRTINKAVQPNVPGGR